MGVNPQLSAQLRPVLATSHIRSKERRKSGWLELNPYDALPMGREKV